MLNFRCSGLRTLSSQTALVYNKPEKFLVLVLQGNFLVDISARITVVFGATIRVSKTIRKSRALTYSLSRFNRTGLVFLRETFGISGCERFSYRSCRFIICISCPAKGKLKRRSLRKCFKWRQPLERKKKKAKVCIWKDTEIVFNKKKIKIRFCKMAFGHKCKYFLN